MRILFLVVLLLDGCATSLKSNQTRIKFDSDPPGATISTPAKNWGVAPVTLNWELNKGQATALSEPITATWISGATTTTKMNLTARQEGTYTLVRPQGVAGLDSDIERARNLKSAADFDQNKKCAEESKNPSCMNNAGVAAYNLGSKENAISWYTLAARYGEPTAIKNLTALGAPVPEPDLLRQQQQASNKSSDGTATALMLLLGGYSAYQQGKAAGYQSPPTPAYIPGLYSAPVLQAPSNDVCNCKGYAGVGGSCYAGVGGPAYAGVGGPAYAGVGGACYAGVGGSQYEGVGGPAYKGVGGPKYDGVGGPAYDGVGGPAYAGVGGPCYAGVGGPCYSGVGGGNSCPSVCK